jgi:hypothetical protein
MSLQLTAKLHALEQQLLATQARLERVERIVRELPGQGAQRTAEAAEFLAQALKAGPRCPHEVYREAEARGIRKRTLMRAKERLGAPSIPLPRTGRGPKVLWALPAWSAGESDAEAAR